MTTSNTDTERETKPAKPSRDATISPDRKWRSFPKVPNLVQYVSTGTYFGRVKIGGKTFRESLETDVFTTAKLRLPDFIKKRRKLAARPIAGTFGEARALYEADLTADHTLKETSKLYRRKCIQALVRSWPGLDETPPAKITETDCREWAGRFAASYSTSVFNNTLSTLRFILARAGVGHDDNPAFRIKRLGVKPKQLQLPEPAQFNQLLKIIETSGAALARPCADFVRFLAFSGCRISEAHQVTWADVDWTRGEIKIQNAKRARTSQAHEVRFVPIIPPMRKLLEKLKLSNPQPSDTVCRVGECEKSLTRACKLAEVTRITHHDLRHLFATRCIESGVDIPTVSRWLGHSDGGALAMKVYGHLRREHSASMAQRVTFGQTT
ncbi:MAG: tyrosine-type recombinase/integrase [Limisphaerales bacterium]